MEQPLVKHLWRDGAVSDKNPERFREVEPLILNDWRTAATVQKFRIDLVFVGLDHFTVPEARALRDWLNKALPEEKP